MCIQLETFLGKWELSTGCLVAAALGPIYTTLFSIYFWLGPHSSVKMPDWTIYIKIGITVYNCLVAVAAFFFAYGILKDKLWAVKLYKNMWNYITMTVISIFIGELLITTKLYPKLYLESVSIILNILCLTDLLKLFASQLLVCFIDQNLSKALVSPPARKRLAIDYFLAQETNKRYKILCTNVYFTLIIRSYEMEKSE